jgi:hypothetical protein
MNANETLPIVDWAFALKIANHMAARTGVRRRVRQSGTIWIVHEVDQPVTIRKTNTEEI